MTVEITGLCRDHTFETAEEVCRRCGMEFCEMCLLFPKGQPLCKECAMVAGGVRNHASRAEMPKREMKRIVKAFAARRAASTSAPLTAEAVEITDPVLQDPLAPTVEDLERVPAPVPDDGAAVASELADVFNDPPPPPPPPSGNEPADGVAPPIDWSQPFG
ncbi:MAG: hypothetical protein DHS20C19_27410 [Acidimicrobiales bacterium]|nr:MAG: hypothetical protein DHS20C19_27410 [Acidimicrobiales bacterium]